MFVGEHGGIAGTRAGGLRNLFYPKRKREADVAVLPYLQFGGSGNDYLEDVHVLASGDILVAGKTFSTTFCGIDISAYTNGTYFAIFVMILGADSFTTGVPNVKASYFITGNGGYNSGYLAHGYKMKVALDSSENVYFLYGAPSAASDYRVKKLTAGNLALAATSPAAMTQVYYGSIALVEMSGNIYCAWFNYGGGGGYFTWLTKFRCSDLAWQSTTTMNSFGAASYHAVSDMAQANGEIFGIDWNWGLLYRYYASQAKVDLNTLLAQAAGFYSESLALNVAGAIIYVSGMKKSDNDWRVVARDWTAGFGVKADFTTYDKSIGVGKTGTFRSLIFDADGRLFLSGYTTEGATVSATDSRVIELNPTTGALISDAPISYSDGTKIEESGKNFYIETPMKRIATDRYVIGGETNGTLVGKTLGGGYDCFLLPVDRTGKMLATV